MASIAGPGSAAQLGLVTPPAPSEAADGKLRGDEGTPLLVVLQKSYRERWAVLLDSLFANAIAERVLLLNPYVPHKKEGKSLLNFRGITLREALNAETAISSRHISSGLLTSYWTHLATVLPALVCCTSPEDRVLIISQNPSYGRLLAFVQLLFPPESTEAREGPASEREPQTPRPDRKKAKDVFGRRPSLPSIKVSNLEASALKSQSQSWDGSKASFEEYSQLPWHVYGEGEPPATWQANHRNNGAGSLAEQIQNGLVPLKDPQGWSFSNLLTGVLQRGIKAGCCVVRTSSGDWAEVCAQEAQRVQREASERESQPDSAVSRCRPCFMPSACLGEKEGEYVRLSEGGDSTAAPQPPPIHLHCCTHNSDRAQELAQLLENHVPREASRSIRIESPLNRIGVDTERWWRSATDDSFDYVVVEAAGSATRDAVLGACQSANKTAWPHEVARRNMQETSDMITDGFYALRPGGHLLFCTNSLAYEETDGLMIKCNQDLQGRSQVVEEPLASGQEAEAIRIVMKKWGAEKTEFGWRLLPDLSFQDPQYFSIIHRL